VYQRGSLVDGLAMYLSCDTKKFHDNESTHILHNFWTSTHTGGKLPTSPPLAAPLTTAEKLGGPHDPLPFPPPSLPRLPLLLHPCLTHSLPCSSFLLPLNLARRSVDWKHCKLPAVPSEKRQPVAVGGTRYIWSGVISKVGGDAVETDRNGYFWLRP